jgi:DNA-binding transcriptional LysR family regulator
VELRHLRYFIAVAEAGSIMKAAARLGLEPPPLGHQIRALETELEVELFDRSPKRLRLNAAGMVFLEGARRVLAEANHAVELVQRFARGEQGRLTVGFTSSVSFHRITPRLIRKFRERFPHAQIEVTERETFELILAVRQRRIDAALLHVAIHHDPELDYHVLDHEEMVVAVPADHPFASPDMPDITLEMFSEQKLVVYRRPDGPGIFTNISLALQHANIHPMIVDEVPRLITALNLVAAGRGISIVPETIKTLHRDSIVYRNFAPGTLPTLPLYLIYRKTIELDLVRNFIGSAKTLEL